VHLGGSLLVELLGDLVADGGSELPSVVSGKELHVSKFECTLRQQRRGSGCGDGHDPGAKKGRNMEFLVVAIVAILGFSLFRYLPTRGD
jgi:hypothetical protein